MPSHNRVELIGNSTGEPKVHTFPSGDLQVRFSLATNEEWQDKKTGDMVKRTDFHNIVVDNQAAAKYAEKYLKKGDLVAVFGQLRNREYEKDGAKQRVTEVVVDRFSGKLIGLQPKAESPG
jgi:single-strand DNA-binding protein